MAVVSEYPIGSSLVRGDPVSIDVDIRIDGVPIDVSGWTWRSQIRTGFDGPLVVTFAIEVITPQGGTVPSTLRMTLTDDEARLLAQGLVFDVEQLDADGNTIETWWICHRLNIQADVSKDEPIGVARLARSAGQRVVARSA